MTSPGPPPQKALSYSVEEYSEEVGADHRVRTAYWQSLRRSTPHQIIGSVSESYPSTGHLFGSDENSSSLPMSFSDVSVGNCRIERTKGGTDTSTSTAQVFNALELIETPMKVITEDPDSAKAEDSPMADTGTTVADMSPAKHGLMRLDNVQIDDETGDRRDAIEVRHELSHPLSQDQEFPLCLGGSAPASYFSQSESGPDDLAIGGVVEENGKLKLIGGHENENDNTTWLCYRLPHDYLTRKRSTLWMHPRIANENGWLTRLGNRPCPIIKARMYSSDALLFTVPRPVYGKMVAWGHYRCEVTMERRIRCCIRVCGLMAVDRPSMYLVRLCCGILVLCFVADLSAGLYVMRTNVLGDVWYLVMVFSLNMVCLAYPYALAKCCSFGIMRGLWMLMAILFMGTKLGFFAYQIVLIARRDHSADEDNSGTPTDLLIRSTRRQLMEAPPPWGWLESGRNLLLGRWDALSSSPPMAQEELAKAVLWAGLSRPQAVTLTEQTTTAQLVLETSPFESPFARLLTPSGVARPLATPAIESLITANSSPSLFAVTVGLVMCMIAIMSSVLNLGVCHVLAQLYNIGERQFRMVHFHQKGYRKLCTAPFELWCAGLFSVPLDHAPRSRVIEGLAR